MVAPVKAILVLLFKDAKIWLGLHIYYTVSWLPYKPITQSCKLNLVFFAQIPILTPLYYNMLVSIDVAIVWFWAT